MDNHERRFCADVHAHLFPTEYLDCLESFGKPDIPESRHQQFATESDEDLNARIAMMEAAGVTVQVLSPAGQLPYFSSEPDAVAAARLANDQFAAFVARRPDRLAAFGVAPLPHVDASLAEIGRALDELGMAGITIGSSVLGNSLAAPEFDAIYRELDRRGAVLYVHPSGLGAYSPLISPYNLTWVLGAVLEDAIAATHLIVAGIPKRYPGIRIIVSHLGGGIPFLLGRLDFLYRSEVPSTPELPSVAARRMWWDTTAHDDRAALRLAAETLTAERLIVGSDYPYQLHDDYTRAVSFIIDSGLPKESIDSILTGNATRLFAKMASPKSNSTRQ